MGRVNERWGCGWVLYGQGLTSAVKKQPVEPAFHPDLSEHIYWLQTPKTKAREDYFAIMTCTVLAVLFPDSYQGWQKSSFIY